MSTVITLIRLTGAKSLRKSEAHKVLCKVDEVYERRCEADISDRQSGRGSTVKGLKDAMDIVLYMSYFPLFA
uniref:HTH_48 domain-containing protein n=1 Tax=Steinernema glaseri TaxID=37863 RepID=A0A1I8AT53_9BILA